MANTSGIERMWRKRDNDGEYGWRRDSLVRRIWREVASPSGLLVIGLVAVAISFGYLALK